MDTNTDHFTPLALRVWGNKGSVEHYMDTKPIALPCSLARAGNNSLKTDKCMTPIPVHSSESKQ